MDFTPLKNFMHHMNDIMVPGNAICVYQDHKLIFSYTTGYADLDKKIPFSCDHALYLYSCSKPSTVTAALQLVEQGLCKLDDPLYAYIPEYANVQVQTEDGLRPAKRPITLRHLFSMQSGLDYDRNHPIFQQQREKDPTMSTVALVKALAQKPLVCDPGERWVYSLSHDVLAAVVEVISGERFQDYMREHIFAPLEIQTAYHPTEEMRKKMVRQYRWSGGIEDLVLAQSEGVFNPDGHLEKADLENIFIFGERYDSGGAGLISSVADYAKFADALACHGEGHNGYRILKPETVELLRTNQLINEPALTWRQHLGFGYGLGVRTHLPTPEDPYRDIGWGGAAGAGLIADPDLKLSVFYSHHMLNPQEGYYIPRLREALYKCL